MTVSPETLQQALILDLQVPVHFIGVGGIGMSGLAKILLEAGFQVSGSDVGENESTQTLKAAGATIYKGHHQSQVPANALVIVSTSIDPENPEIRAALNQNLGIYHRSSLLREILQGGFFQHQTSIGITGTHGKTTITGMTGFILQACQLAPTIVVGGNLPGLETNAVLSPNRQYAVAELDESDGSILQYTPTISLISNLELDHADQYQDGFSAIFQTFERYLNALKPGSKVLFNVSCPNTKTLLEIAPQHIEPILIASGDILTGQEAQTTYWLKNARPWHQGCYQGYVYKSGRLLGELNMTVPGMHNLFNGLAAVAVGDQLGLDFDDMAAALRDFSGMRRRFEKVGEYHNALLIDDYAHHPTEVAATLKAARESMHSASGRLIAIFQPHRYTRLQALWEEFKTCFGDADVLYLADVYAASEAPIEGITSEQFASQLNHPYVRYIPGTQPPFEAIQEALKQEIKPGDLVLSMGAGSITHLLRHWNAV